MQQQVAPPPSQQKYHHAPEQTPSCSNGPGVEHVGVSYQDVFPVLHEEDIRLVQHQQLYGRQEVKVSVALSLCSQNCAEAKWRCNDDV